MLALSFLLLIPAAGAYTAQLKRYPYLTDVVGSSATVNWATDRSATTGVVKWGTVGGSCTTNTATATRTAITVNSVPQYQWSAPLTVSPNQQYCYRVYLGSSQVDLLGADPSPSFFSQLPAGSSQPFSFAVFGDWGDAPNVDGSNPDQANLMQQIAASGARFAVTTGDQAYPNGSQTNYGDLVQQGQGISAVFGSSFWTVPGKSIPIFPATGNHGFTNGNVHLLNWPQSQAVSSSGGRYLFENHCCLNGTTAHDYPSAWYAFDAGNSRFYVLNAAWANSNVGTADVYKNDYDYHWTPSSPEYQWLKNDLATHASVHKFAFWHFPLYSDQAEEQSDPWLRSAAPPQPWSSLEGLLGAYGVDLGFTGHAHIYQRNLKPHGNSLPTYVTGGGGGDIQSIGGNGCSSVDAYGIGWSDTNNHGNSCGSASDPTARAQVFHFLKVTVNGSQVTVTPTNSLGQTFDVQTYSAPPPVADLSLTKSDSPDPVQRGQLLTYTLTATNNGPSGATGVTLTDDLPAGATYDSSSASQGNCSPSSGLVTCNLGNIASLATASATIKVRPQVDGAITNSASVQASQSDPTPANNQANESTLVNPVADLSLTKTDSPDPVLAGNDLTYNLTVQNSGPSGATGVTLTDNLPGGVIYQSATPSQGSCNQASGTVTCGLGAIASSGSATVQIVVKPQGGGTITNTASVSASQTDPSSANNSASAQTTVTPVADMALTKTDSPDPVLVGGGLTYNLTARNTGPSGATGVTVTDTLPAGVTYQSATPSQGNCGLASRTVTCNLGSVVSGGSATVAITVTAQSAGTITNTASVLAAQTDPSSANNSASAQTTVSPVADLALTKSDSPDPVAVGQQLTYTLTAENQGPSSASAVQLTDDLPSGITFDSATPSQGTCQQASGTVTCDLVGLASGASATVEVRVTPQSAGTLTNNASLTAAEADPDSQDNSASEQTQVDAVSDLALTKADSPDPVRASRPLTYTLTAQNQGPSAASAVALTDNLPAGVAFVSANPSQGTCEQASGTVTCDLGALASGASATVQLRVTPPHAGTLSNTASVVAAERDPSSANNTASEQTQVDPAAYAHPASAAPISASLVPVFRQCGTVANPPNREHSPPLDASACAVPRPSAAVARTGEQAVGSATLDALPGDLALAATVTDVRALLVTGADYDPNPSGDDLDLRARLRITDIRSGPTGIDSATSVDFDFGAPVDCTSTADPDVGATCNVSTTANALFSGAIQEGAKTLVQVFRIRLNDAGTNGTLGDSDDSLFEQQGIYEP